jgi:hypothetical protein
MSKMTEALAMRDHLLIVQPGSAARRFVVALELGLDPGEPLGDLLGGEAVEVPGLVAEEVLEPGAVVVDLLDERQASPAPSPSWSPGSDV